MSFASFQYLRRVFAIIAVLAIATDNASAEQHGESSAAVTEFRFEQILDTGLQLSTIHQDEDGFIWIASINNGLLRFDADRLRTYKPGRGSLSSPSVNTLFEDRDGLLWIATSGGLNVLDRDRDTLRSYRHDPADPGSLSSDEIHYLNHQAIAEDRDGGIWIATSDAGVNRFDKATSRFTRFRHDPDQLAAGPASDQTHAVLASADGAIFVYSNAGLSRYDPGTRRFTHYHHDPLDSDSLGSDHVSVLLEDRAGGLWVGTVDAGLHYLDRQTGKFIRHRHRPDDDNSLCGDAIWSITEDSRGLLWVAHRSSSLACGLASLDPLTNTVTRYAKSARRPSRQLSSDAVMKVYEERVSHALWVVHYNGLIDRFDPQAPEFRTYRHDPQNPHSLSANFSLYVTEDRDGAVWVGTLSGGLNRFDPQTETWSHYQHDPQDPTTIANNAVAASYEDPEGFLWLAYDTGGISRFNKRTGQVEVHYKHDPDDPHSISESTHSNHIAEDAEDDRVLWISHNHGTISRFSRRTGQFENYRLSEVSFLLQIHDDAKGSLWLPNIGGLVRFDKRRRVITERYTPIPDDPNSLASGQLVALLADEHGRFWLGTWNHGLSRFDPTTETFENFLPPDRYPVNSAYAILSDSDGNLWVSGTEGLVAFNVDTGDARRYVKQDGLQGDLFFQGRTRTRAGELWFAGINGVTRFDPRAVVRQDPHPPQVRLTSLTQNGKPLVPDIAPHRITEITLPADRSSFQFEFAVLNYTRPERNRFRYRLEGVDDDWVDIDERGIGRYPNLSPGRYTLRLTGANNDGVWSERGASLTIVVPTPWWQTTSARLAMVALIIALIIALSVGYVRYRTRALRQQVREAQQLGGYTLLEKLGEGGIGVVWRARHAMLRRPTVVKLLQSHRITDSTLERFEREVQLTSQLNHPNIIVIYDYGRSDRGVFYYAMEYLDGMDTHKLVRNHGPQPVGRVIHIMLQVCSALSEAHKHNLVHRDIKPANLFLCRQGSPMDVVKVLDFGLVKKLDDDEGDANLTRDSGIVGTPAYLAPEAIKAPADVGAPADIYALGAVGYFLVTGEPVFSGATFAEVCAKHLYGQPRAPSATLGRTLPEGFDELILACLAKQPRERPTSAAQVTEELQRVLASVPEQRRWDDERANRWWCALGDEKQPGLPFDDTQVPEQSMDIDWMHRETLHASD